MLKRRLRDGVTAQGRTSDWRTKFNGIFIVDANLLSCNRLGVVCQRSSCATICKGGIRRELSRELFGSRKALPGCPHHTAASPTSLVMLLSGILLLPNSPCSLGLSVFGSSEGCADVASVPRLLRDGSSDCIGVLRDCRPRPRIPRQLTRGSPSHPTANSSKRAFLKDSIARPS